MLALDPSGTQIVEVSPARTRELLPIMRPEAIGRAAYEEGVFDMDVHAIHHGFLRGLTARGGDGVASPGETIRRSASGLM